MSNQFFSLMSLVSFAIGNQVYMFSLVYGLHWNRSIRRRSSALACTIMQLLHIGIIIIPHYPYDLGLYVCLAVWWSALGLCIWQAWQPVCYVLYIITRRLHRGSHAVNFSCQLQHDVSRVWFYTKLLKRDNNITPYGSYGYSQQQGLSVFSWQVTGCSFWRCGSFRTRGNNCWYYEAKPKPCIQWRRSLLMKRQNLIDFSHIQLLGTNLYGFASELFFSASLMTELR